jgi:hypothetical protein
LNDAKPEDACNCGLDGWRDFDGDRDVPGGFAESDREYSDDEAEG